MVEHPPLKRTMRHGLRLTSDHKIAESLRTPAKKTLEWVKNVLTDNQNQPLDKRDLFRLNQVLVAAERLLTKIQSEKDELRVRLEEAEDSGIKVGFHVDEIRGMNATAFLIDNEGWLKSFIERARKKFEERKVEISKK